MTASEGFFEGKLLIAMPGMPDDRFARSVIFMCAHSETGAMGLVINRTAEDISLGGLLAQLSLVDEAGVSEGGDEAQPATPAAASALQVAERLADHPVHIGGPVETKRGFVLHTRDYFAAGASVAITDEICLTATVDVLRAIAEGTGPRQALLALGYSGWAGGQLERELQANSWLHAETDPEILFRTQVNDRYEKALAQLGVDLSFLVDAAGHA